MTVKCCVCTKIRVDNQWLNSDSDHTIHELVSHSYCPRCFAEAIAELNNQQHIPGPVAGGISSIPQSI